LHCTNNLKLSLLIAIFLLNFCVCIGSSIAEENAAITITGVITNLEKAKKYIAKDSYLQLVFLPSDGQVSFKTDGEGRMTYESELAKINIPSTGNFIFETASLKPGQYLIAAQLLKAFGLGRGGSPLLAIKKTKKFAFIEVPEVSEGPIKIELGEVIIPVP